MLNEMQNAKMIYKLKRCLTVFEPYIFRTIDRLPYRIYQTREHYRSIPDDALFTDPGEKWGGEWMNCWFKGCYTPRLESAGKTLYVKPSLGGYEGLLWINNEPRGAFATKIVVTRHGNHFCSPICQHADSSKTIELAIEFYAGHYVIGCLPFETAERGDFMYPCGPIEICEKVQDVADFICDLRILIQLVEILDEKSFRRAEIMNVLTEVHRVILYSPENAEYEDWIDSLRQARSVMQPALSAKNGTNAPIAALTGHSHMDTAWLWPVSETIRKNARTVANQLSMLEYYPEYQFIQSASLHSQMIEQNYPQIFSAMKEMITRGRYEVNGGVWVECDCNITGGESIIRQFLWGQRYTLQKFGILSDCFWLPDTFGYSAAIPQIMRGFGIKYFLTTKMAWNDTNRFPYNTFVWEGIDQSQVLAHLFVMDTWVDPQGLLERINGIHYDDGLINKQDCSERLVAFGYGDGGGGPTAEMIETARRMENLEGCPKTYYSSVSAFMNHIEETYPQLPRYKGELYLELHRGTLTNKQQIKKNNRKSEVALHNLELLETVQAIQAGRAASVEKTNQLWGILLKNQFHDILPGSCIAVAHDQSIAETNSLLAAATEMTDQALLSYKDGTIFDAVFNSLGFEHKTPFEIPTDEMYTDPKGELKTQQIVNLDNEKKLVVSGLSQKPFCRTPFHLKSGISTADSPFLLDGNRLETAYASIRFDEDGYICSMIDKSNQRELCRGIPLGTFASAEDVPAKWDGWDIDADYELKLKAEKGNLISREVVSNGAVELRIRSRYKICRHSVIDVDQIFYAESPLIEYDVKLDWRDPHYLLKVLFDTTVSAPFATFDIQFGNIKRATTRNNTIEQARFEVCCHKYVDLSEPAFGFTVVNDCKYGVSVRDGLIGLSLAKGGTRPDERGDVGVYRFRYGYFPHTGGYCAKEVILPAYCFNYPSLPMKGTSISTEPLLTIDSPNVIIETVKPCEDSEKAFIARIYESEGSFTSTKLHAGFYIQSLQVCNMMEQPICDCDQNLIFQPFEIKTIKIKY